MTDRVTELAEKVRAAIASVPHEMGPSEEVAALAALSELARLAAAAEEYKREYAAHEKAMGDENERLAAAAEALAGALEKIANWDLGNVGQTAREALAAYRGEKP